MNIFKISIICLSILNSTFCISNDLIEKLKTFQQSIANKKSTRTTAKNGKFKISIIPNTHILVHSPKGMCGSFAFNDCRSFYNKHQD